MLANSFQNTGNWTTNPKKTSENVDVRTFLTTSFCKNKERYARFMFFSTGGIYQRISKKPQN